MSTIAALDIGDTQLRTAAYKEDQFEALSPKRVETKANKADTFGQLIKLIEDIWPENEKLGLIGGSSPGSIDPDAGIKILTPNIKEWHHFPITSKLCEHFCITSYLDNDANRAGLTEKNFGARALDE